MSESKSHDDLKQDNIDLNDLKSADYYLLRKKQLEAKQKTFKYNFWILFVIIACSLVFFYLIATLGDPGNDLTFTKKIEAILLPVLVSIAFTIAVYTYYIFIRKKSIDSELAEIEIKINQIGSIELQEKIEENFFTKLVQINFKYLDRYYLQTHVQASKSFWLASAASIVGLLIIVVGIVMMFLAKTEPAYVTTAVGVLSEFIAAIFFYLYNRTVQKMAEYHHKLVITQNISLALKISEDMAAEDKAKVQRLIINRLTKDINKYLTVEDPDKK